MRGWKLLGGIGVIMFICSLCYLIYTWPIQHPVSLQDLLVDPDIFPAGWEVRLRGGQTWEHIPDRAVREDYWALEGVMRTIKQKESHASVWHRVLRYQNQFQAAEAFIIDLPRGFPGASWYIPEGWNYRSLSADRFRFACTYVKARRQFLCSAMAQYNEIISILWMYGDKLGPEQLQEIRHILNSIDRKTESILKMN